MKRLLTVALLAIVAFIPDAPAHAMAPATTYASNPPTWLPIPRIPNQGWVRSCTAAANEPPAVNSRVSISIVANPATSGLRRHHRHTCSTMLARRASIGRSARYSRKSSASAPAD